MKKQWMRAAAALLSAALFCCLLLGCSSDRPQDGTYTARYRNASGGYVEYLTVTFRDGKVTDAAFDGYLESDPSKLKSQLTKEEYPMDPHPSEWMPLLAQNVKAAGKDASKIATVAGATSSTGHARELYKAILKAAAKGNTAEIILDNEKETGGLNGSMSDSNSMSGSNDMSGSGSMADSDNGLPDGMTGGDSMDGSMGDGSASGGMDSGMSGGMDSGTAGGSNGTIPDGNSSTDTADGPGDSGSASNSGSSSSSGSSSNSNKK